MSTEKVTLEGFLAAYRLPDAVNSTGLPGPGNEPIAFAHTPALHLRVNFISSADGAVTYGGHSGALGGANDRLLMRVLRAMSDVVLVGAGTVRAEGYGGLGIPLELRQWRAAHIAQAPPRIVIATNRLDLTPDMPVFAQADARPIIAAPHTALASTPHDFSQVADLLVCGEQRLDLEELLGALEREGLGRVLCEGGPHLFGALLDADLVDEVCLTVSPTFTAGAAGRISASPHEVFRSFLPGPPMADDEGFVFLRYLRR